MSQIGVALVLLLFGPTGSELPPQTAPRVGLASVVERDAKAQLSEAIRVLILRDPVFRNERLTTGAETGTLLHLRLLDETVLTLGPSSEMVLDDFAINPGAGTAEVQLSLSRGLLRFVGGKHAGTGVRYQVKTPVATIGVRGTSFNLRVDEDGSTEVQLEEGELVFENALGDEVFLNDPYESSFIDDEESPPSEPEVDMELAEEFDSLDLSPEQLALDEAIADELEGEEIEPIEGEDPDDDSESEDVDDEDAEENGGDVIESMQGQDFGDDSESEAFDDEDAEEGEDEELDPIEGQDPDDDSESEDFEDEDAEEGEGQEFESIEGEDPGDDSESEAFDDEDGEEGEDEELDPIEGQDPDDDSESEDSDESLGSSKALS